LLQYNKITQMRQAGFSLIELMVGLVIGLLATLVVMQVFANFEGQKRSTTGNADAQINGSIALFTMQRDIQSAGFGLPVVDTQNSPLRCNPSVTVDHDGNAATPVIDMFPISITDGGTLSDSIIVRYATDGAVAKAGLPVKIDLPAPAPDVGVENNFGCNNGDVVLISSGAACAMTRVNDTNLAADTTHITLVSAAGASVGASLSCMGRWNQFTYVIANNQLQRNDATSTTATPIVSEIVSMQAQYGISATADSNQITQWVSATAPWATPSVADRNRIKAVHVVIVARNGLQEKDNVTNTCTTAKGTLNNGPCAWDDADLPSAAPAIDLSADANWQRYRYRAYDTIIPIRNMIWAKNTL
jgi:type IV pilus assembly protein PilW